MKRFALMLMLALITLGCATLIERTDFARAAVPDQCLVTVIETRGIWDTFVAVCPGGDVYIIAVHEAGSTEGAASGPIFSSTEVLRVVNLER